MFDISFNMRICQQFKAKTALSSFKTVLSMLTFYLQWRRIFYVIEYNDKMPKSNTLSKLLYQSCNNFMPKIQKKNLRTNKTHAINTKTNNLQWILILKSAKLLCVNSLWSSLSIYCYVTLYNYTHVQYVVYFSKYINPSFMHNIFTKKSIYRKDLNVLPLKIANDTVCK